MRLLPGKWFVVLLVTLCLGLQVLEATGQWDRSLQDAGDEAVIVAIVLCIGAAVGIAAALRTQLSRSSVRSLIARAGTTPQPRPSRYRPSISCDSPPTHLRI